MASTDAILNYGSVEEATRMQQFFKACGAEGRIGKNGALIFEGAEGVKYQSIIQKFAESAAKAAKSPFGMVIKVDDAKSAIKTVADLEKAGIKATFNEAGKAIVLSTEEAAKYSKYLEAVAKAGAIKGAAKLAGRVATPILIGFGIYEGYEGYQEKDGHKVAEAAGETVGALGGMAAGAKGGAVVGAWVGSFFGPGPGTVIGGAVGAVAGGIGGGFLGAWGGGAAGDAVAGDAIHGALNQKTPEQVAAEGERQAERDIAGKAAMDNLAEKMAKVESGELRMGIGLRPNVYGFAIGEFGYIDGKVSEAERRFSEAVSNVNWGVAVETEAFRKVCQETRLDVISQNDYKTIFGSESKIPEEYRKIILEEAEKQIDAKKTTSVDTPNKASPTLVAEAHTQKEGKDLRDYIDNMDERVHEAQLKSASVSPVQDVAANHTPTAPDLGVKAAAARTV